MLEVKNCKMMYGDFTAVHDLSFTVRPGEIFGLLGTNGAGKTTTFRIIMGLLEPTVGEVLYFGEQVGYHNVNNVGYMIEERSLLTKVTVKELLLFFGQLKDMHPTLILERLDYWLERFKITEYKDKKIRELSKGNQQKIQFISAIINEPSLILLDEPFSGLDPINTKMFEDAIRDFQKKGAIIIFSSHQLDHVEEFCEQILILEKGRVVISGHINDIKDDFQKQNIRVIGDVNLDKIKAIEGVLEVNKNYQEIIIKIATKDVAADVFNVIKESNNIQKYDVEQASLSEIFVAKVGEVNEEV